MKTSYFFFLFILTASTSWAQRLTVVSGKITDQHSQPIPSVNVKIVETNQYTITDKNGRFNIQLVNLSNIGLTIEFSFIGFQKLTKQIKIQGTSVDVGALALKELNLSLATIDINAKRNYEGMSNSSLLISRDIIEQTPALSLSDLLNQIPNRKMTAPSLQNVQNITLRSSFAPTTNNRGAFEMNNSFGVAIIMDGNAISNNMNMQSYNPGMLGAAGTGTLISATYGLKGSTTAGYSGDYAFSGTDLRQIPADNIESIEVIAGVAPAKYGDLSDGAVIVERQAGRAPAYLRMQLRDNATSYGYSQGFKLSPKAGSLNVGLNYVNSFADNRDKLKAYKRITTNAMYTNSYGKDNRLKNTLSMDYSKNLDGVRRDPDDITSKLARFDSWNVSVVNRSSYRMNTSFLKNISLNLRYAEGHQVSYTEQFQNDAYVIVSDATTTGIHEGSYAAGIYTAASLIDGRPVNASAKLDFNADFKTGNTTHFLGFGLSYDYGANKGLGQVLDPKRPRSATSVASTSLIGNRSERYYDFNLAVAQQNVGLYAEDIFKLNLFDRELNIRGGVRYDLQNSMPSFSPRLNMNYVLNPKVKIGFAYGLAFKSPSLSQLYPGPTYYEIPLLNAYNGNAGESIYLAYVSRYDPDGSTLKSSKSQTFEFTSQIKIKDFNLSLALFHKQSTNGISTVANRTYVTLPVYTAAMQTGTKPIVTETGTKQYMYTYHTFNNDLTSDNQGLEVMLSTPQIKQIATQFSLSGGIFRTNYETKSPYQKSFEDSGTTMADYAVIGYYEPTKRISYLSNARIGSTTHIPKISLMISLTAEFSLMQKNVQKASAGIPVGYLTRDGRYITVNDLDTTNPNYKHLFISQSEINENNIPHIIPNFHLSLAKEIKKRFRFAFNVYNVFNYQPYYISSTNTYTFPNAAPSFGAEISLKL